ncbi:AlpA family phage regulatory protein [Salmonella enterica]|nr:AlpA family phage regulatory protein [Salmonella enterica]EJR7036583.1 AlpA family phage regulatory protein [Salmonella enterica]EJS6672500.1 AlpA family phage regulatory protein [Salmonella enterica]ELB6163897.1 AlpA family phage regulatory protein [Salmonella enterica]
MEIIWRADERTVFFHKTDGQYSLYRMLQRNEFPRQVRIGIRSVGFYEHEVNQWLADRQRVQ